MDRVYRRIVSELLDEIVAGEQLTARAAYGFFPANALGDDVEIYPGEDRRSASTVLRMLRQQSERPADQPQPSHLPRDEFGLVHQEAEEQAVPQPHDPAGRGRRAGEPRPQGLKWPRES